MWNLLKNRSKKKAEEQVKSLGWKSWQVLKLGDRYTGLYVCKLIVNKERNPSNNILQSNKIRLT